MGKTLLPGRIFQGLRAYFLEASEGPVVKGKPFFEMCSSSNKGLLRNLPRTCIGSPSCMSGSFHFNIVFMRFIHIVTCDCKSFFLIFPTFHCMGISQFAIHSPADEHLVSFQCPFIMNHAATNFLVKSIFADNIQIYFSWKYT